MDWHLPTARLVGVGSKVVRVDHGWSLGVAGGLGSLSTWRHRLEEIGDGFTRKFDAEFKEGTVWIVRETGGKSPRVADELGINSGTLGTGQRRGNVARWLR